MKKLLSVLMIFVLVLSGCGTNSNSGEKVNLTWYTIGTPPADGKVVNDAVNEYLDSQNAGYNVDIVYFDWAEYDQKIPVKLNAGEPMDIMFSASWAVNYTKYATDGYFYDLSEFKDTVLKDTFNEISPVLIEGATINDGIYGIPTNKEVGWDQQWIWDAALVEKYDVPVDEITTLEQALPYIEKVSKGEPDYVAYPMDVDQRGPQLDFNALDCAANTNICFDINNPEAGYQLSLETEGTKQVLKTRHDIQQAGYAGSGYETKKFDRTVEKAFLQIAAGFPTVEIAWEEDAGRDLIVKPIRNVPYATTSSTTGALNAVSANSKYPEEAASLLNMVNTDPKLRNLLAFGIEGTHYNFDADGKVEGTEQGINSYNVPIFTQGSFFIMDLQAGEPDNKWELMEKRNEETEMSPTLGFSPDLSEFDTQLASLYAVDEQYVVSIMMGEATDFDVTLQEYINAYKSAGSDEVTEEINRQYNEWKANQEG